LRSCGAVAAPAVELSESPRRRRPVRTLALLGPDDERVSVVDAERASARAELAAHSSRNGSWPADWVNAPATHPPLDPL